jgi:hypothetical protein
MAVRDVPLAEFLAWTEPGDRDWSWNSQFRYLQDPDNGHTDRLREIFWSLTYDGQKEPVQVGPDSRLWDGHHRVWALVASGARTIRVDYVE